MSSTPADTLATALAWHTAGASVVRAALDGTKRPLGTWKAYQNTRADEATVRAWFADRHPGIGLITGTVSSNLEMLEFEGRAVAEGVLAEYGQICDASGLGETWARLTTGYAEQTPSGGLHLIYRVVAGPVLPNTKLARRPASPDELAVAPTDRVKPLIETRGEGGFVVIAPSHGTVHPTGQPWTLLAGSPATVPALTGPERDALFQIARMLDQMPTPGDHPPSTPDHQHVDEAAAFLFGTPPPTEGGVSPGDDYEARTDWADILRGWTLIHTTGRTRYWRRPGKDRGLSASTGRDPGRDRLYVFTTSTEFESERPYTKFGAYALLHHAGDHTAAARQLRRDGYGTPAPEPVRHLTPVPAPPPAPTQGTAALKVAEQPAAQAGPGTYTPTDDGNALRLIDTHEQQIRYVPQRGKWLKWDNHRWAWDDDGHVRELAREIARDLPEGEGQVQHRLRSLSAKGLSSMVTVAQTDPRIVAPYPRLDTRRLALNTPGGTVDLHTGLIAAADPAALHTRSTTVAPSHSMPTPRWDQFLTDTFGPASDVASFVQRLAGYSASGDTRFHILPFLHGPGGNGKSVFLDVIRTVLGDYATTAPNTFLMAGQQQHETEVARLHGLRLVVASEVNQDARFDEAKVKLLTGGDALTARFMRQDHFTFEPTHHLWLMGNHLPAVKAGGESFWRRLRLIPFTRIVPNDAKIEGLAQMLALEEGPGILAWIIQGAVDVFRNGLREPASVMAVTENYAEEEDSLARFVADCCHLGGGEHVLTNTARLRSGYDDWCRAEGELPLKPQVFGRELRTRFGIEQKRSNGKRFYVGIALLEQSLPERGEGESEADRFLRQ